MLYTPLINDKLPYVNFDTELQAFSELAFAMVAQLSVVQHGHVFGWPTCVSALNAHLMYLYGIKHTDVCSSFKVCTE